MANRSGVLRSFFFSIKSVRICRAVGLFLLLFSIQFSSLMDKVSLFFSFAPIFFLFLYVESYIGTFCLKKIINLIKMNISYNWLKRYLNLDIEPEEVSKILTSIGLEVDGVEEVESIKGGLEGLVVGEVLQCENHPDSDHLHVARVNVGSGVQEQIRPVGQQCELLHRGLENRLF